MASSRILRQGNLAAALVAVLAIAGFVNYFGHKYHDRWDWTSAGFYSLADRSERILDELDTDVRLVSFLIDPGQVGGDALAEIQTVLETIAARNPQHVTLETIDPQREPIRAESLLREFDIDLRRGDALDVVVVESGTRRRQVRLDEMVQLEQSFGMGQPQATKAITVEGAMLSAIFSVTRQERPRILFASGHGEREFEARHEYGLWRLVDALRRDDAEVESWDAAGQAAVPPGTNLLVIPGPQQSWLAAEAAAVEAYLEGGGRVLLFADPVPRRGAATELVPTGLEALLGAWGLELGEDVVLDPTRTPAFMGPENFLAPQGGGHPITERLGGDSVLFTAARSVRVLDGPPRDRAGELVETSVDGWGETDLASLTGGFRRDEADYPGPVPVAVAVEGEAPAASDEEGTPAETTPTAGRLVVMGDVELASNYAIDQVSNRAFVLNTISWLLDEDQALGIPPKDRSLVSLTLGTEQIWNLGLLLFLGLPLVAILAGVGVWWQRRRS